MLEEKIKNRKIPASRSPVNLVKKDNQFISMKDQISSNKDRNNINWIEDLYSNTILEQAEKEADSKDNSIQKSHTDHNNQSKDNTNLYLLNTLN